MSDIPMKRPQEPHGSGLEALEHGGKYPDSTPQAIRVTDREARSRMYLPSPRGAEVIELEARR